MSSKKTFLLLVATLSVLTLCSSSSSPEFAVDGKVLELVESNFESAISSFDYILVDFYAPWCGHCKRLAPELDAAAPDLSRLKQPIVIAKLNADKYNRLAHKYEIDGYPSLKLFIHGVPTDYYGPRKAELLVRFLKKYVAADVAKLDSDSAVSTFIEEAGIYFPIYIGFGVDESMISNLAVKYKKKAWFAVAKDFSEDAMIKYDFDKVPALVSIQPNYKEQSIFYGPFEDKFLEDFIKQSLFPLVVPINYETLKLLRDDERKIALALLSDDGDEDSLKFIKLLKAAASANRDLVFAYIGVKQWGDFAETFGVNKQSELPKMVIWDGNEEYYTVVGSESIAKEDQGSEITRFLEGYRSGKTVKKRVGGGLSFLGFLSSLMGIRTMYVIVFMFGVLLLILTIGKEEPLRVGTRDQGDQSSSTSDSRGESSEGQRSGEKED